MKKVVIILEKNLRRSELAQVSAILMGQASRFIPELYDSEFVLDRDSTLHAGIRRSISIHKAGKGQLVDLVLDIKEDGDGVTSIVFTEIGNDLYRFFERYKRRIIVCPTGESKPIGILLVGDHERVERLTSRFALLQ